MNDCGTYHTRPSTSARQTVVALEDSVDDGPGGLVVNILLL